MNEVDSLTVSSWFSRGWSTFKRSPKQIIGGAVILSVFSLVLILIDLIPGGFLVRLLGELIVGSVLSIGWCFLCLRLVRGDDAKSSDIFGAFSRFGTAWATFFLLFLIVFGGSILFVIPGIIWFLKYNFSLFAVMDRQLSAREAIRFSGKITKGHKGKLFGAYFISFLLLVLLTWPFSYGLQHLGDYLGTFLIGVGIVPYLVSVLVFIPWIGAMFAAAYDSLVYNEETEGKKESDWFKQRKETPSFYTKGLDTKVPCATPQKSSTAEEGLYPCLAGFWSRCAAALIDFITFYLLFIPVIIITQGTVHLHQMQSNELLENSLCLVFIALGWLYFSLFEASAYQGTLGKIIIGIKITDLHGQRISFGRASGRFFAKFLSMMIFFLGFLMAGWTLQKQALHDMISGTLVFRKKSVRKRMSTWCTSCSFVNESSAQFCIKCGKKLPEYSELNRRDK